jgi:MFS family permease
MVSFFADLSTEMVYPLIPLYLTSVFGATPALVGLIEGIAESLASLLRVFGGYISDKFKRKKPIAFAGYSTGLIYKVALLFAGSWAGVLAARVIDRFGKGIRTAPRDVLVSESGGDMKLGHSFGLHKMLDMAGSAAGILGAYFIMRAGDGEYRYKSIFVFSAIPMLFALALFIFIRETGKGVAAKSGTIKDGADGVAAGGESRQKPLRVFEGLRNLDGRLKLYLTVVFIFTLGNSSNTFLLLRAGNVGFDAATVVLLYFLYNIVSSLLSLPFGRLSDRLGRKRVLVAGYLVFSIVYAAFAWAGSKATIVAAFALYGVFTAATAGVERAFIAELAPRELKGTVLGLHSTIVGIALFPASLIAGLLWNAFGPVAPFALGAGLSLVAALSLGVGLRPGNAKNA